jgi:hypothetical protein
MARPRKRIDPEIVERLAMIGCTTAEIASVCECSSDTLERRFAAILRKGREKGKSSLRLMQWKAAESGNVTMMIWLGKQLLGQRERLEHTGADGGPVKHVIETVIVDHRQSYPA